jgi:DNA-binding transcriptional LysR family regulator
LTARLRRFREAHPGIDLRLQTALSAEVSALVRRGDAALGLRYAPDPHPELISIPIHEEPLVPVSGAHHPLVGAGRVTPAQVARERWVGFPPAGGREPSASAVELGLAACGVDTAGLIRIDSLTAQKRMVEAGFGLALLQASSVADEVRAGTLRVLRVPTLQVTIPVVLIHRRRAYLSGAVRALMALLVAWRSPGPDGEEEARPRRRTRPGRQAGVRRSSPSR